ncbi:MAG: four helix bundle protein [Chloracidobacterium sp.]|nr:four helix bundle protein [Chloracidobacterium sp.]
MARIERFEDIEAWKLAREVTRTVYAVSSSGAFAKDFALVNQIRRAAVSILSNIAEGFERNGDKEFVQFLTVAKGSCGEVRAQLYIAMDQGYLDEKNFLKLREEVVQVSMMIAGLIAYLKQSELKGSKFR